MAKTTLYDAIILRVIDTGEADRFCIFLTREGGRKAAGARSVRKPNSRLGGILLSLKHITLELRESDSGSIVSSAQDRGDLAPPRDTNAFLQVEQGIELLLALTEEDQPLPEIFDLLFSFIRLSSNSSVDPLPAFTLRLLHLLGLLPATEDDARFGRLSPSAKTYVQSCTTIEDMTTLVALPTDHPGLSAFIRTIVDGELQRPLRSTQVARDVQR